MALQSTRNESAAASGSESGGSRFAFVPGDLGRWIAPVISIILILVLWQASIIFLRLPRFILPPPLDVLTAFFGSLPLLLRDAWVTLRETLAGFFLSIVVAVPLAILITSSAPLR